MSFIVFIATIVLNLATPWQDWHGSADRDPYEEYSPTGAAIDLCVWRYQQPETMMCIEIPLKRRR